MTASFGDFVPSWDTVMQPLFVCTDLSAISFVLCANRQEAKLMAGAEVPGLPQRYCSVFVRANAGRVKTYV